MSKVFVEITAKHDINGSVRPLTIKWEDGRVFEVDRVLDYAKHLHLKGAVLAHVTLAGYVIRKFICLMMRGNDTDSY